MRDRTTHLRYLVAAAWKALGTPVWDDRDFLTAVRDTVAERDRLREEVEDLRARVEEIVA